MTTPVPPTFAPPRRGAPKIVPVVVSAGLAVGVFFGLLFGLGAGKPVDARPGAASSELPADALALAIRNAVEDARTAGGPPPVSPPIVIDAAPAVMVGSGSGSGSADGSGSAAGSGEGSGSAAATGSGSATAPLDATKLGDGSGASVPPAPVPPVPVPVPPTPAITKATLTLRATPASATITVDKQAVQDGHVAIEITGGKRKVRIEASASGYRSYDKTIEVTGDQTVDIKMTKRAKKTGGGGLMEPD